MLRVEHWWLGYPGREQQIFWKLDSRSLGLLRFYARLKLGQDGIPTAKCKLGEAEYLACDILWMVRVSRIHQRVP